ncbi:MAG: hypothetical protein IJE28_10745, partial [Oscillospiraceae bacterium]|nr:hypothetical protein [Oscillospiraceae bacterium]
MDQGGKELPLISSDFTINRCRRPVLILSTGLRHFRNSLHFEGRWHEVPDEVFLRILPFFERVDNIRPLHFQLS